MIDKKKIGKASAAHAKATWNHDEEQFACMDGFDVGVHWAIDEFLKDLWHPAIEEPDYLGRRILYEYKSNGVINPSTRIKEASLPEKLHWKEFSYKPINPERIITRWLYIDDLLPKKGGSDV